MRIDIRDQRNGNWYWIAREVYQKYSRKIGVVGLALYNAYASYSFNEQEVYPSQTTIAKKLNISIPTLIKYNKKLIKYKLISIDKREGQVNIITLLKIRPLKEVKSTTKPRLGVPLKEVKSNKKKRIIINKQTDMGQAHDGLFSLKDKKTFECICAIKLIKLLQIKNKIMRKPNIQQWASQFRILHIKENVKKSKIREVLKWYFIYIGEKYVPDARSAKAFRIKFDDIVAAMNRFDKQVENGEQKIIYTVKRRKAK